MSKPWYLSSSTGWLALWFCLALVIRLLFLTSKPFWMDEVATAIFTLGNSSHSVLLDQVISLDQLLTPLRVRPEASIGSTINYLMQEDNHPPAYFVLAHLWMNLFPPVQGLASPWAVRALPALLGAVTVPAAYLAGWLGFRSVLAGQLAAAFMAVSPFGVAMAQEARHYSMATLMVTLGLACFAVGAWSLRQAEAGEGLPAPISPAFGLLWVGVNALAFATHYFTALALLAQALVLAALAWHQGRAKLQNLWRRQWQRLYWVMLGTLAGCVVWFPVLLNFYGSSQASNLAIDLSQPMRWLDPIGQTLAGLIFMLMTPITHAQGVIGIGAVVLSVLLMLPLLLWTGLRLFQARRLVCQSASGRFGLFIMGGFVLAAIALFFAVSYGLAMDITRGHRYNFVFYPGVMVLLGGLLAVYWPEPNGPQQTATLPVTKRQIAGWRSVQGLWIAGLASALFVVSNLAFAKYYEPADFVRTIQTESIHPALVGFPAVIETKPTVIGLELLSIGWEIQRHFDPDTPESGWLVPPQFFIWSLPSNPVVPPPEKLADLLSTLPRPFDLWFLHTDSDLSGYGCTQVTQASKGSHNYSHYECTTF
ncbi:glycosyltransferase [Nodosilinea sp. LEGE 07088]|uniref:glycosyltransferase family 39 protein n=1 Tax=Nodosilinea sp. LEGE 07088 TaxID=2777968 RepID=UPI001881CBB8|nr:glycosyltransferase [Nodosilinea sp. LEGE 07088]MBE9136373.1 glycosyltransferase [Nodosilinea sp. LEGE 07088]